MFYNGPFLSIFNFFLTYLCRKGPSTLIIIKEEGARLLEAVIHHPH